MEEYDRTQEQEEEQEVEDYSIPETDIKVEIDNINSPMEIDDKPYYKQEDLSTESESQLDVDPDPWFDDNEPSTINQDDDIEIRMDNPIYDDFFGDEIQDNDIELDKIKQPDSIEITENDNCYKGLRNRSRDIELDKHIDELYIDGNREPIEI
jgi:hypothetical protein